MPVLENKFTRWDEKVHHPAVRCDGVTKMGPCPYVQSPNSNFCAMHGGNKGQEALNKETLRSYNLQKWQSRVGHFAGQDSIKGLREEIGILRMMLETMLNQCETQLDLLMYTQRASDLIMKIERVVTSCDKLENRMGQLLNKDSILQLASTYVQIINMHVTDPDVVERISEEMVHATEQIETVLD